MGYQQLPEEAAQALYRQMEDAVSQIAPEPDEDGLYPISEVVYEDGRIDESQIHMVVSAFSKRKSGSVLAGKPVPLCLSR